MEDYSKDELLNIRWNAWQAKRKKILLDGLESGDIKPYDEQLISKLRRIYDGGLPASVILLSDYLTNGKCFDRAFLLSRAFFLDEDTKDFKLVYAYVDSLKLNPKYIEDNEDYAIHCVLERTLKDDTKLIYDTSVGFIFNKNTWEELENPSIVGYKSSQAVIDAFIKMKHEHPEDFVINPMAAAIILPIVESHYGEPAEHYAWTDDMGLKDEVELFKKVINYNEYIEKNKETINNVKALIKDYKN